MGVCELGIALMLFILACMASQAQRHKNQDLDVSCTPHFRFKSLNSYHLVGISTNFTLPIGFDNSFNVTYCDLLSNERCDSFEIPSSSCVDGLCHHEFNVSSSPSCFNATAINVTVHVASHTDLHQHSFEFESMIIDAVNNFVQVSFELSVLNLNFIDQPKEGEKSYSIMYGPVTQDCKDLPSKTTGHLSNVNSISLQLNHTEGSICFILVTNNGTKSTIVEGIYVPAFLNNTILVVMMTTLITGLMIAAATGVVIIAMYHHFTKYYYEKNDGELDEEYTHRSTEFLEICQTPIDASTTYYKIFNVTDECLMYEFGMRHFPDYNPEEGFGFFKKNGDNSKSIFPHKKVILMDEDLPKFTAFTSAENPIISSHDVYEQNRSFMMKLTPGSMFLYCERSKDITSTAFWRLYDVHEQCNESNFAEKSIPRYTSEWSRYCHFEFTKPEHIKPHQRVVVLMKDGRLFTGPGVRRLVGAIGDGSKMTHPPQFNEKWDCVFIQNRGVDRELSPGTKYLFCATMNRVHAHYSIYNIHMKCNMAEFGKRHIPGFKPDLGYGYFEFTQDESFKPQRRMILVHKDKRLFTGVGVQFICADDEHNRIEAILRKDIIPPPDLSKTEWKHIFIQSYSKERELLPGTKFLYCEYRTYK